MTAIDSIEIPAEFVALAEQWHSGQGDLLYAVASTGGLTLGNRRPLGCETDEQWYLQLWRELSCVVTVACRAAAKSNDEQLPALLAFDEFVEQTAERLAEEYGLADWEC